MKTIGVIAELNPLHDGHKYLLKKIKSKYPNSVLIVAMSGNVVQRGGIAIESKFERARKVLNEGVDIVLEIPSYYSLSSADFFAKEGVKLLEKFGVNRLIFGSESNDPIMLKKYAKKILAKEKKIPKIMKKEGISYSSAIETIIKTRLKMNDLLAVSYLKSIFDLNVKMDIEIVKRIGSFKSATELRNEMYSSGLINRENYFDERKLFKLVLFSLINSNKENSVINYINNSINKEEMKFNSLEELIDELANKIYTKSRLRREIFLNFFGLEKSKYSRIRVLSSSLKGNDYLKRLRNKKIYTTNFIDEFKNEIKISRILDIVYKNQERLEIEGLNFKSSEEKQI